MQPHRNSKPRAGKPQFAEGSSPCDRCGKTGHTPDHCYFKTQRCRACGKRGHIAKVCRSKGKNSQGPTNYVEDEEPSLSDTEPEPTDQYLFNIKSLRSQRQGIVVDVTIDGVKLAMELDTGAAVSLISETTWKALHPGVSLDRSTAVLKTYTGERLCIVGQKVVEVEYEDQRHTLPLVVVAGQGPSLFGLNWLDHITLNWGAIKSVRSELDQLLQKHEAVFRPELGTLKGIKAHLEVDPQAPPKFCKPRTVAYALREAIEKDLERLEQIGVVEKVQYSDWAAPIVPVPKQDGSVRICGDYRLTVNPALKVDQYPVPTAEDLFSTLAGGTAFTKLDLSQAYQQVELDESSQKYVTISTHRGLYRYKRLPFGVASAPALFQQIMDKILQGIPRVVVYIDDILITGSTEREHLATLGQVLTLLEQYGIRLKRSKCRFLAPEVDYLGYRIDKTGLRPLPSKLAAIQEAPEPQNTQELRAFLGLVNYYGKFMSHLSTLVHPLNRLLCKGARWVWSKECKEAFGLLKTKLASSEVLAHYDPKLPLRLDCDASPYGVGAVLSHKYPDGLERPIAYASRTLTSAETNYAQLEKEALALIFGVKKFHKYVYGRKFTLVTDHKPLLAILGSKKGLPTLAAARLQRWAIFLLGYQYDLEFRPTGSHCNADGFSRLPRVSRDGEEKQLECGASVYNLQQIEALPLKPRDLQHATAKDPVLSTVLRYTREGWPRELPVMLKPYAQCRLEISVDRGCLFRGGRVIVPADCQRQVLAELHAGHQGIVKMKGLARSHVWWPGIDSQVEALVHQCTACQATRNQPPPAPLHPWPCPPEPWHRVHIDFAGPFMGSMFLVVVDSHSRWLEVEPMQTTTTTATVGLLRAMFARYGLPRFVVSDNGPQFTAKEFAEFLAENGVQHIRSAPYHPATNGMAERFVQTFKQALRSGEQDQGDLKQKLARFLMMYRTTPHSTTGISPAELFLNRRPRTRLDVMKPATGDQVFQKQMEQKKFHDKRCKSREFMVGQSVLVRNVREGPKWLPGEISAKLGPVSYEVSVAGQVWKRHADQLLSQVDDVYSYTPPVRPDLVEIPDVEPALEQSCPLQPALEPTAESAPGQGVEAAEPPTAQPSIGAPEPPLPTAVPVNQPAGSPRPATTPGTRVPSVAKTYPRRDRHPVDRYEPTF